MLAEKWTIVAFVLEKQCLAVLNEVTNRQLLGGVRLNHSFAAAAPARGLDERSEAFACVAALLFAKQRVLPNAATLARVALARLAAAGFSRAVARAA